MKKLWLVPVLGVCATTSILAAGDLGALGRELREAKSKVTGSPRDRAAKAAEHVDPVVDKIAGLGTDEALALLLGEVEAAPPEIAAACARGVVSSRKSKAISRLLAGLAKKPPVVCAAVLNSLNGPGHDLKALQKELVHAADSTSAADVKSLFPPLLGKLESRGAAQAILALIGEPQKGPEGARHAASLAEAVASALETMPGDEVKKWLARDAFSTCRGDAAKLAVVARAAGKRKLEEARKELEALLDNPAEEAAAAGAQALASMGGEASAEKLIGAFERRAGKAKLALKVHLLDAIAATQSPRSVVFLRAMARDRDASLRSIAIGSLASSTKGESTLGLLDALKDAESSVRSMALEALKKRKEKEMIRPLIEYQGTETEPRLKLEGLRLLVRLTGLNLGTSVPDWKKWWEAEEARFKFPDEKVAASLSTSVKIAKAEEVTPSYFGLEVASSKKLGFLVDASGSMTETVPVKARKDGGAGAGQARKIDVLKSELTQLVKKLPAETMINIVAFSAGYRPWQQQLQSLAGGGRSKALDYVKSLGTSSGTNVFDTLEFALKDRQVDTIYLLTDGLPTAGRIQDAAGILTEVKILNRTRGAVIHCIAFGEESQLLRDLAAQNGGEYRFVNEY